MVYVFNRKSGRLLSMLSHAKDALVHTVGVSNMILYVLIPMITRHTHRRRESIPSLVQHQTQVKPMPYPYGGTAQVSMSKARWA